MSRGLGDVYKRQKTQNRIIVVPGANMTITTEEISFLQEEIGRYDMVLLQLEIPMQVNEAVVRYAHEQGVPVMLNSAPADTVSQEMLAKLDYISPNEYEAAELTGITIRRNGKDVHIEDVKDVIECLLKQGVKNVLITLGTAGAAFGNEREFYLIPTLDDIAAVDPTGAGDSFVGAFSTFVSMGIDYKTAVRMSNYVGSLTVSAMGAQPSLPTLEQVQALIRERGEMELLLPEEDGSRCG